MAGQARAAGAEESGRGLRALKDWRVEEGAVSPCGPPQRTTPGRDCSPWEALLVSRSCFGWALTALHSTEHGWLGWAGQTGKLRPVEWADLFGKVVSAPY